ncbi:vacuolar membrane protein [Dendrothele bispora CBS 962.96]|uniref:Vacuolar membrane protein n=1 Tax=Dendrothele bispora (strain CBS 962.96) TaxID=1314807 RepID=A0A4S8MPB6_DENBC|nr:vacuolar membrane protein [Dendrothele bispora CBS 962.96]
MERARSRSKSIARSVIERPDRDYIIGIVLLLVVVLLWTASNFVTQDLFQDGYEKAFLVTYLNTSAFTLYLVPSVVRLCLGKTSLSSISIGPEYEPLVTDETSQDTEEPHRSTTSIEQSSSELPPLTVRETIQLASTFCFFWFIANWTLNMALDYTSVASATILSSMSGFFTLGIGRIFKVEVLTLAKIGAVITSFIGVVLVSLSDSSQGEPSPAADSVSQPALGDFLALLSALFYALYVILLKVRIGSESRIDAKLFFGFVGLFNIIFLWPIGVVLHLTGIEKLELPSTQRAVIALLVNMFFTWSSDYLYVLAMLKTTPLVVTIGLSLTIPLAVVGDFILSKPTSLQVIIGAILVLASFLVVGYDDIKIRATKTPSPAGSSVDRGRRSQGDVELDVSTDH